MKQVRIAIVASLVGLLVASCGGSSDSAPRQRNLAPVVNVAVKKCVFGPRANCEGAYIADVNRSKISTNWTGANFSGVTWDNASFVGVTLNDANFSSARLSKVHVRDASATGASFVNAHIRTLDGATIDSSQRNYGGPNFTKADFSYSIIENASFMGAKLNGAKFFAADLSEVDFSGANLTGVDLSTAQLNRIKGIAIVGTPKLPAGWKIINKNLVGPSSSLRSNLTEDFLSGVNPAEQMFATANAYAKAKNNTTTVCHRPTNYRMNSFPLVNLSRTSFAGVTLSDVDFSGTDLSQTSFDGMTLENVNFSAAKLVGTTFRNTTLKNVDFSYADISNVNLSRTKMSGIVSQCTFFTSNQGVPLPAGWRFVTKDTFSAGLSIAGGVIIGPGSDLSGKNLTGIDLSGIDLSTAVLSKVKSGQIAKQSLPDKSFAIRTTSTTKLPQGFGIRNGMLFGPEVDLSYSIIRNLDLSGLSLYGARFEGVVSANLRGDVRLDNDAKIVNGYLIAPGVNLSKAKLNDADLSGLDLGFANLEGADLRGATLDRIHSGGVVGLPLLPSGWTISGGLIFGPTADLSKAVFDPNSKVLLPLDGIDLSGASLDHSIIRGFKGTPTAPENWTVVTYAQGVKEANALIGPDSFLSYEIGVKFPKTATLPSGYARLKNAVVGPHMEKLGLSGIMGGHLEDVDFSGSQLSSIDFSQTVFSNVKGADIRTGASASVRWPAGWNVVNSILMGPSADLRNLRIENVSLAGIDLSNAKLSGVYGRGLTFDQTTRLPMGWGILNGVLVGPEADLTNAYIADVILEGVDLSNAELTHAIVKRVQGSPVLPDGYQIVRGNLVGGDVDIVCSDVTSSDFGGSMGQFSRFSAMFSPQKFGLKKVSEPACR